MAKVRINGSKASGDGWEAKFNWSQFAKLRKSDKVHGILDAVGEQIVEEAENYPENEDEDYRNKKRYTASVEDIDGTASLVVYPSSPHAVNSNAKHNTLYKILNG